MKKNDTYKDSVYRSLIINEIDHKAAIIKAEVLGGSSITQAVSNAQSIARELESKSNHTCYRVLFDFNGISMDVRFKDDPEMLVNRFRADMKKNDDEYRASPEYKEDQERGAAKRKEEAAAVAFSNAAVDAKISGLAFDVADAKAKAWEKVIKVNENDDYGSGIVRFADRWARLMQYEISTGAKIKDIYDKAEHDADNEGVAGNMVGVAAKLISSYWKHGEEFRQAYNSQFGAQGKEANKKLGATINPAILIVGAKPK